MNEEGYPCQRCRTFFVVIAAQESQWKEIPLTVIQTVQSESYNNKYFIYDMIRQSINMSIIKKFINDWFAI